MRERKGYARRGIWMLLAALLISLLCASGAAAVEKTVKAGLQEENGKYYYYVKGVKVRSKWKTVKVGTKSYRYYFGKTGAAYAAPAPLKDTYNVKVYKIGKNKYGFDREGHMVTGLQGCQKLDASGRTKSVSLYYFNARGIYKDAKTKKIRKLLKQGMKSTTFITDLKKLAGKPAKIRRFKDTCNAPDGNDNEWRDVSIYYGGFEIIAVYHITTGEYYVDYYAV